MYARKSNIFLSCVFLCMIAFALMFAHAHRANLRAESALQTKANMVARLALTDLCLFTDARYARHLSMADRHTPFQDSPLSLEHFPSGTIITPPAHLQKP